MLRDLNGKQVKQTAPSVSPETLGRKVFDERGHFLGHVTDIKVDRDAIPWGDDGRGFMQYVPGRKRFTITVQS